MSKKVLLINSTYEIISFINEKKAIKLLCKEDKVEVISSWDEFIYSKVKLPAILRLKNHVKRNFFNANFSRKALIKRDKSICQFCKRKLSASQITIDHVLPRAQGGVTSFTNCVVSCQVCNNLKADRTPEQANMKLLKKPVHPSFSSTNHCSTEQQEYWHQDWNDFLRR